MESPAELVKIQEEVSPQSSDGPGEGCAAPLQQGVSSVVEGNDAREDRCTAPISDGSIAKADPFEEAGAATSARDVGTSDVYVEAAGVAGAPAGTAGDEEAAPTIRKPRSLDEVISSQLQSLEGYHRAVLQGDNAEAVHKMRVTTRRLQASLDLLQSGGREFKIRTLKRRLRRWRRRLSLVRNYDVFLLMVAQESAAGRSVHRQHFESLSAELQKRRARESLKVDKYLRQIRIWSIGDRLGMTPQAGTVLPPDPAAIDSSAAEPVAYAVPSEPVEPRPDTAATESVEPGGVADSVQLGAIAESLRPGALTEPLDPTAIAESLETNAADHTPPPAFADERRVARRAADRLDQRLAEFKALAADARPSTDPAEIHRLRIAAKRLRYLMEAVSRLGYGDATRAIHWLRSLQDNLGDWHDIDAFEDEVIDIVRRRRFMKANLVETGGLLQAAARLMKKKETLTRKTFPVKPPAVLSRTSTRLSRALRRRASLRSAAN